MGDPTYNQSCGPLRRTITQEEAIADARQWLDENYGFCKKEDPDKYYERLGFLYDFVTDLIPNK